MLMNSYIAKTAASAMTRQKSALMQGLLQLKSIRVIESNVITNFHINKHSCTIGLNKPEILFYREGFSVKFGFVGNKC